MTRLPTDEVAAFIGIDWADAKHDICLQAAGSETREFSVLEHQPDTIDEWVSTLRARCKGHPIAICLERNKGPLVSALRKHDFLVLFPVTPLTLARYREAFAPSQAKDDPTDAERQLELLLKHRDKLKPLQPQSPTMRALEQLADVINQRLHAIKNAPPLTTDEGVIPPNALLVQALVAQLRVPMQAIEDFDKAMAQRTQSPPDFPFFDALPGAGAVFAPRLLVAFGEQRDRSISADELQKYAGIAPVTERSGTKAWVHWRLQCPKFLRQTFVEWAAESTRHSFWARAYYQQQRDKGASPQAAVRALAFTEPSSES